MVVIKAEYAHKLSDDSQRNFYNDNLKAINDLIQKQASRGGYGLKYPISFKISFYFGDNDDNEISKKQEQDRIRDVENIVQFLRDLGYTITYVKSAGEKEIPHYNEDENGNEYVYEHETERTHLYELTISW